MCSNAISMQQALRLASATFTIIGGRKRLQSINNNQPSTKHASDRDRPRGENFKQQLIILEEVVCSNAHINATASDKAQILLPCRLHEDNKSTKARRSWIALDSKE